MENEDLTEYYEIVDFILNDPEFIKRKDYPHHGSESVYDHSLKVSILSYKLAKKYHVNYIDAAIGGLLHDFYYNTWQDKKEKRSFFKLHGFVHASEALDNSRKHFGDRINKNIENAIVRHMFPLNKVPPTSKVGWIVTMADKYISLTVFKDIKNLPKYVGIK